MKASKYSITKNLGWKALSLFVAIVLWFLAVGIEDPTTSITFKVPLEIKNLNYIKTNNKVILNYDDINNENISVVASGKTSDFKGVTESNIKAYIDLKDLNFNDIDSNNNLSMKINIDINSLIENRLKILSLSPNYVNLTLDDVITKEFPIKPNIYKSTQKSFLAGNPTLDQEKVKITGAKSIIDSIDKVLVDINLQNSSKKFNSNLNIIVYDKNKKNITNLVKLDKKSVNVEVPISKYIKIPVLEPKVTVTDSNNESIKKKITYKPNYIEVIGSYDDINKIKNIQLPPIDITSDLSEINKIYNVRNLLEGTNVYPTNSTPAEIIVNILISKDSSKIIEIPIGNFNINNSNNTNIDIQYPDFVKARILGNQQVLDSIKASDIKGSINIGKLKEGENNIDFTLNLPENVILDKNSKVKIMLNSNNNKINNEINDNPNNDINIDQNINDNLNINSNENSNDPQQNSDKLMKSIIVDPIEKPKNNLNTTEDYD